MDKLPFRQIHLDFHTSEKIKYIGAAFDKEEFKRILKTGHVNSITLFAKCHHGWSYYDSDVNPRHPELSFNLLDAQLEACKEIDVRTPIYISAGFDEKEAHNHPEWILKANTEDEPDLYRAGYHRLCFNTPYLDLLVEQTEELMQRYNPTELFFDICNENVCCCDYCKKGMIDEGLDFDNEADRVTYSKSVFLRYKERIEEAVRKYSDTTAVFHNAGNIPFGRRDFQLQDSHLELESLPTGGWGYDHFPMSCAYCRNLDKEYVGMTGKFHNTWGEFGGFKHFNALRYETSLSLAMGAKCSVGDQLHPNGALNEATYSLIGKAYSEVEKKEPWCHDVCAVTDIGVLSSAAFGGSVSGFNSKSDVGANRILLEGKFLYSFIDCECDFNKYKLLILPDDISLDEKSGAKLLKYLSNGGKVLATGSSANGYLPGIQIGEKRELKPDYMQPVESGGFSNGVTQYVMYTDSYRFEHEKGFKTVAYTIDTYFNRTPEHFSSHQHTPDRPGFMTKCAIVSKNIGYINHKIFEDYAVKGELHCKELTVKLINILLNDEKTISVLGLPDRGITTLQYQASENRMINHMLFAHTSVRGNGVEVIEDIIPLYNVSVKIKSDKKPASVTVVPEEIPVNFSYECGIISYTVDKVDLHSMVEIRF